MSKNYNIAVIGATGNVGRETINILHERQFPCAILHVVASKKSIGKQISFGDRTLIVCDIENFDFTNIDLVFFSAGSEVSKKYIPKAIEAGAQVIDKSSYLRMDAKIPLIIPEVNLNSLNSYSQTNIISNPNCCTIPLAMALKPLDNEFKIKRIVASTYQSVSGAGKESMDELYNQTKAKYMLDNVPPEKFPTQIAFNLLPQIGNFQVNGYTSEEEKIADETAKILGNHIKTSITCVRVPIFRSHSISVNVELEKPLLDLEAYEIFSESDGILINTIENQQQYVTPIDATGEDAVFISRLRQDLSQPNSLNFWICCDNLRKGAALNAVQIAESIMKVDYNS